jgi:hypothetical protein
LDVNHVLVPLAKEKIVDLADGGGKSHLKRNVDFTLILVQKNLNFYKDNIIFVKEKYKKKYLQNQF